MKKTALFLCLIALITGCTALQTPTTFTKTQSDRRYIKSAIDLVNSNGDRVQVTITPATIFKDSAVFYIPETVPGTYSDDDYGQFVDSLYVYSKFGGTLKSIRTSPNSWVIPKSKNIKSLQYYVNDTYDVEDTHEIFSPAGTNFKQGEQFMLNLHALLGYFKNQEEIPYYVDVHRPKKIEATTSLPRFQDSLYLQFPFTTTLEDTIDTYRADRYFSIVDNPIMYNEPNKVTFELDNITVGLSVYSPTGIVKAEDVQPNMERMMRAQKEYLGDFDATKKYNILLYLTDGSATDAQRYGALEHHTSTVTVLPEAMPQIQMDAVLQDVISHEFFHILTPLNLHSTQIHKFKYNDPEMSKHLWMYEGVTEYFAQHFQVQQGLVSPEQFYETILQKIKLAGMYDDAMSFTEMSEYILQEPYASNYANVYEKGALIAMCLDIMLREESQGNKGLLDLMKELTYMYGPNRPFEDDAIIPQIVQRTNPEIGDFFKKHVIGTIPIQYKDAFEAVGLEYNTKLTDTGFFLDGRTPFINANEQGEIYILPVELHSFFEELGIQGEDVIKSINGKTYNIENIPNLINDSNLWKVNDTITFVLRRDGNEIELTGTVSQPQIFKPSLTEIITSKDTPEANLRNAWLKGS